MQQLPFDQVVGPSDRFELALSFNASRMQMVHGTTTSETLERTFNYSRFDGDYGQLNLNNETKTFTMKSVTSVRTTMVSHGMTREWVALK